MSYSFGWWDFEDGAEPQMICRDTDERVVMVGTLAEPWLGKTISLHPELPQDRWRRFEYRHIDFWFPLIVNWDLEAGNVLVDYNLSSELWRQETNADTKYLPYGDWIRVDDMVPDAFWSWPGYLEKLGSLVGPPPFGFFGSERYGTATLGHWCASKWRETSIVTHCLGCSSGSPEVYGAYTNIPELYNNGFRPRKEFEAKYESETQRKRVLLPSSKIDSVSEWHFNLCTIREFISLLERIISKESLEGVSIIREMERESIFYLKYSGDNYPYIASLTNPLVLHPTVPEIVYTQYYKFQFWCDALGAISPYEMYTIVSNRRREFSLVDDGRFSKHKDRPSEFFFVTRLVQEAFLFWKGGADRLLDEQSLSRGEYLYGQDITKQLQFCPEVQSYIGYLGGRRCLNIGKVIDLKGLKKWM